MDVVSSKANKCEFNDIFDVFNAKIAWFLNDFNNHYKAATGRELGLEDSEALKENFKKKVTEEIIELTNKVAGKTKTDGKYITEQKIDALYKRLKKSIKSFMMEFEK